MADPETADDRPSWVAFSIWKLAVHALYCQVNEGDQKNVLNAIETLIEMGRDHCDRQHAADARG